MEAITGVPANEVGRVVQDYINDGAAEVIVERMPDGNYRVARMA